MRKHDEANLRSRYSLYLEIGFAASLLALIALFNAGWSSDKVDAFRTPADPVITVDELPPTRHVETPPPPPRPRVPVIVPDETALDDEPLVLDPLFQPPLQDAPPPPDEPGTNREPDEPEVFMAVEEMPTIVGGMAALYEHLEYPEMARRAGVEGTVVVQFVVDETGAVVEPKVLKGLGAGLDEIALDAVKKVRFTPGRQRGKAVRVRMSVPIVFRLR